MAMGCRYCAGSGNRGHDPCEKCGGMGIVSDPPPATQGVSAQGAEDVEGGGGASESDRKS